MSEKEKNWGRDVENERNGDEGRGGSEQASKQGSLVLKEPRSDGWIE